MPKQLDHLNIQNGGDLNETKDSRGKNETRARRGGGNENSDINRYFINVGSIEGFTKGDLVHFLSDISDVDLNCFNNISFQKNCSYFDVDKGKDSNLSKKFEGIEIDGREIRVNKDDDGGAPRRKKPESGYNREKKKFGKPSSSKGRGKRFRN